MRKVLATKFLFAIALVFCCLGGARADIAKQIGSVIGRGSQKKDRIAVKVIQPSSGKTIFSYNQTKPMVPASNMKLAVTAGAIEYLGSNYTYNTKVGLSNGSLVIIGGGDPLLGDKITDSKYGRAPGWLVEDIISALQKAGVDNLQDIIIDTSIFDDNRVHPAWPVAQLNRPYACQVSGLNYNGNCVEITAKTIGKSV